MTQECGVGSGQRGGKGVTVVEGILGREILWERGIKKTSLKF